MSETQQDQGSALPGRDESGRTIVLGFETAGRGHGGEGALYVRVRRLRGGRP